MRAYLYLEDGSIFEGSHFGAEVETDGEVVFSTGMTGYEQSLTDPSFAGQILVFTFPLIGNYGVPKPILRDKHLMENFESEKIWVQGVVVGDVTHRPSHYQSNGSFDSWLQKNSIPGITGIDTRALTQKLRESGTLRGKISLKKKNPIWTTSQINWVQRASIKTPIRYKADKDLTNGKTIAVIDCGVKHGILRALLNRGFGIIRIPWNLNPLSLKEKFDGVLCSNGPGDPKNCAETVTNIQSVLAAKVPFLGICLGHQLFALASGADTFKLPYGHRGLNQPCQDVFTKQAYLTSQNHGYAVKRVSIPESCEEWFISLNDDTNEGLRSKTQKAWSIQFHPEGEPGPFDTDWIFEVLK